MGQLVFGPYDNSVFDEYYYDDDYTFRVWIPPALLTECSKFRIAFGYYSTSNVYIDKVYVGQSSGATADSAFDGTPVAVLFSGVAATTYNSAVKYSDLVEYDIDPTKGLIVSMEFGASHSYMPYVDEESGDEADITTYRDYGNYAELDTFTADATYAGRRHVVLGIDNLAEMDDDLSNVKADANINHAHRSDAIGATADIGTGDNGTVTTTVDLGGTDGNNFTIEVEVAVGVDQALAAAIVGQAITVTLGTDGAGDPDDAKNTATLVAAAVDALADVSASASGTGNDPLTGAEGPTSFTGGIDQWRTFDALSDLQISSEVTYFYVVDTLPDVQLTGYGKIGFIDLDDGVLPDLQCTGQTGVNAELGRHEDVYLPDLRCEGQTGERADLSENLPDLQCTGYTGAHTEVDLKLPDLECEGTGLSGQVASLDDTLPDLDCTGYTGTRCGTLKLPDLQIEATASGSYATLDSKIPALMLEAEGSTPTTGVLDMDLTFPSLEMEMSLDCRAVLESDFSNLKLSATAHGPLTLTLDATLSDLKIEAELRREVTANLDSNLPGLQILGEAHCDLDTINLDENLPVPKLSSTAYGPRTLSLDATLSDLRIEIELRREVSGTLDTDLPGLRIESAAHCDLDTISLDDNLPMLAIEAHGYSGETGELDATLPDLQITASILSEEIGDLDATLPALVMGDTRTGGTGGESGTISYHSRFADYILRHAR